MIITKKTENIPNFLLWRKALKGPRHFEELSSVNNVNNARGGLPKNFSAIKIARTSFFVDAAKSCDYATFVLKDISPIYPQNKLRIHFR